MQDEPSLATSGGAGISPPTDSETSPLQERETESSMSRLSAKVDSDRAKGGVSRAVYSGYLKACGMLVVSLALAISILAQVGNFGASRFDHRLSPVLTGERDAGQARGGLMLWQPPVRISP